VLACDVSYVEEQILSEVPTRDVARGRVVVKALCYKPQGLRFETR
jgi:hypothetical protein